MAERKSSEQLTLPGLRAACAQELDVTVPSRIRLKSGKQCAISVQDWGLGGRAGGLVSGLGRGLGGWVMIPEGFATSV